MNTAVITFIHETPALNQARDQRRAPFAGRITQATFDFPSGTNGLVEVRLLWTQGKLQEQVIPKQDGTFIAGDGSPIVLSGLTIPVDKSGEIMAEWNNYDGAFAHKVPVTLTLEEGGV